MVAVGAVGCGGVQVPSTEHRHELESDITSLWTQIREWERQDGIQLDQPPHLLLQMRAQTVGDERRVCPDHHEVPRACDDTCNLSDAICDNAEQICKVADELGKDDDWAQGKCDSAKASCRAGKQKCCQCSAAPPASPQERAP
jgi:hypothetical protein